MHHIRIEYLKSLLCILLFSHFPEFVLHAEQPAISFDRYNTDNGMPSNKVHCVYQDHKGYIWLGTSVGLIRYNGYSFTEFKHLNNDSSSLGKGNVWAIYEDPDNNLWIGTLGGGLNLFNRDKESFIHYYKQPETGVSVNDNNINSITADRYGNIWIGTGYGGLNCFHSKTKTFSYYKYNSKVATTIGSDGVMSVFTDNLNNLWVGTWGGGLNLFDYRTGKFKRYHFDSIPRSDGTSNVVWTIYQDKKNNLWLGSWGSGLLLFDRTTTKFTRFTQKTTHTSGGSDNVILSMLEDDSGNLWIGSQTGLRLLDKNTGSFLTPKMIGKASTEDLYGSSIYSLFKDRQGIVWIGTWGDGINVWDKSKKKFILHPLKGELEKNWVNCAFEDESGNIWIGAGGFGIVKYDKKLEYVQTFKNENARLTAKYINSICNFNNDNLLLSTFKGLYQINKKTGNIHLFKDFSETNNASILNYKNRYIYFSKERTLVAYDIKLDRYKELLKQFNLPKISCFIIAKDTTIWIGTENSGIFRYNLSNNSIVNYKEGPKSILDIKDNNINCLFEDKSGNIWAGTSIALVRINPKLLSVKEYEEKDGLANAAIFNITEDNNGSIWISTENGISQIELKSNIISNYSEEDGLPDKTPGFNNTNRGEIILTGAKGFSIFNPQNITKNKYIPSVHITEFRLFNKPVPIGTKDFPLRKHISETKNLILNHKQSVITFSWVGLNFRLPVKNQYAYKMEGFEKEWNFVGPVRTTTYTNLNPGQYTFKVKASNNDGLWNETGTSIKITILPPIWKTWWFKFIIILLTISSLYALYRRRIWRLTAQKTILQNMVTQRTAAINKQKEILGEQKEILQKQKEALILQADNLQEANFLLLTRKEELEVATEELQAQGENLYAANEELLRLNTTKDRLFSIIAHDLKNPFSAIIGLTEFLSEKIETMSRDKITPILENILLSSKTAYKLLETLLEWARSQTNNIEFHPASIPVKEIIHKVKQLNEAQIAAKKLDITVSVKEDSSAFSDLAMIEAIIRNLLSNAIKFTPPEGSITITSAEHQDIINDHTNGSTQLIHNSVISVSDSGIGMSPEDLEALFRLDVPHIKTGTAGERGTGLGLIICREFAEKNGGWITVESEPGKGSTFSLFLPSDEESAHEIAKTKQTHNRAPLDLSEQQLSEDLLLNAAGEKYQILIVEDNPELLSYLMRKLAYGFHVEEAKNGKIGLEKAFEIMPDLIISDVMMPEMDGFELCKTIKEDERTSHIPVILLTARIGDENHLRGLETGANDYLIKPFNIALLNAKIKNTIEIQRRLRERYAAKIFIGPSDLPVSKVDALFIKRAVETVEKNISDSDFNVQKLAQEMNMSHYQLGRKLQALANLLPGDFISSIRLKRAAQLIVQGHLNINQVCFESGFSDPSYFTKCFKKEFGVLPKDYTNK